MIYKTELDKLEQQILKIEESIEENDDFIYESDFEELNDKLLEKEIELEDMLSNPYDDRMSENEMEKVSIQVKRFKKLRNRIKSIQETAGKESEDDIRSMMFPNDDDE